MKKIIYCKTAGKGKHSFYLQIGAKSYYLFTQKYHVGVHNYFAVGRHADSLAMASKFHDTMVRKTAQKLPSYLKYAEKENDVVIYDKKIKKVLPKIGGRNYSKEMQDGINEYYFGLAV